MNNRDAVGWSKPPTPGNRSAYDWPSIASQLRANPGEWMLIYENGPRGTANGIRMGHVLVFQEPGFEVTTRNNNAAAGTCTLYLRYVPPEPETPRRERV